MSTASHDTLRTVNDVRRYVRAARGAGRAIGLVPTMGALHEGHLSLIRTAQEQCDTVIVSVFVNPAQFDNPRDLASYHRDERTDTRLVFESGGHALFAPSESEIYPHGFSTTVDVGAIALPLEGIARGAMHFRGVATVVAKLFSIVQPDAAFFGQKDLQQTLVIRRMTADLDIPVKVVVLPTVREADGLAMSSRNMRLSPSQRLQALGLVEALRAIELQWHSGERSAPLLESAGRTALRQRGIESEQIDYLAIVHQETLAALDTVDRHAIAAVAAHVGEVRLIDNIVLSP